MSFRCARRQIQVDGREKILYHEITAEPHLKTSIIGICWEKDSFRIRDTVRNNKERFRETMTIPNFWVRIRKLVLPEPLHGSWGSEETALLPAEANVSGWASSENIRGKTQFTVTYVNKL